MSRRMSLLTLTIVCAGLTAALAALAVSTGTGLLSLPVDAWGPSALNQAVVLAASAAGAAASAWHALSGALALATAVTPHHHPGQPSAAGRVRHHLETTLAQWGAPLVRRIAAGSAAGSLAVGAFGAPAAMAAGPPDDVGWTSCTSQCTAPAPLTTPGPDDVGWVPPGPSPGAAPRDPDATQRLTVAPGDSLWSLTEQLLTERAQAGTTGTTPPPTTTEVAQAWPRLYSANSQVIGVDPHLIRPGTSLVVPTDLAS